MAKAVLDFAWGRRGARQAAQAGHVAVIVDTLSFSTAVAAACSRGARVFPCMWNEDLQALARSVGGEAAVKRAEVPHKGRFSLSPRHMSQASRGDRVVLQSPNGATCARLAQDAPAVIAGGLVNVAACAKRALADLALGAGGITVVACGERHETPDEQGDLRFAVEDYLAAALILRESTFMAGTGSLSANADALACGCAGAMNEEQIAGIIRECQSGGELVAKGWVSDVEFAVQINSLDVAPILKEGAFEQ